VKEVGFKPGGNRKPPHCYSLDMTGLVRNVQATVDDQGGGGGGEEGCSGPDFQLFLWDRTFSLVPMSFKPYTPSSCY